MNGAAAGAVRGIRLRPHEVAAVRAILLDAFGPEAEFYVFGSRARLDLKGGDLDLFVRVPGHAPDEAVIWRIEDRIEKAMEERHTDLLVLGTEDAPERIHAVALETGVRF